MQHDFLIVGGGISGASAAWMLAREVGGDLVVLLEQESQPGYHTTGRSAATLVRNYGNPTVRGIIGASSRFLEAPPDGFAEQPLLSPRGVLTIARPDQTGPFDRELVVARETGVGVREIGIDEALSLCPVIDPGYVDRAAFEPDAADIDVDVLFQGFLRGFRAAGGTVVTDAAVTAIAARNGGWRVATRAGDFDAGTIVNAAGAWADEVAGLAGIDPVGLQPLRRTVVNFDPPDGCDVLDWPLVIDVDEDFYFRPEAGRLMGSPADETPVPPQDAQPEELDIAIAIDRIQTASTMTIRRLAGSRAGLRTFAPDRVPVVGPEPGQENFIWLAGQGGYGIMTAPALGLAAAAAATGQPAPQDQVGCAADLLSPARFR